MKAKREPAVWIFSATAVVMLLAMVLFIFSIVQSRREGSRMTANEVPRSREFEVLARVYPPAYRDLNVNSQRPAEFGAAMQRYSQRDYNTAIPALAAVVEKQPGLVEARLYLGICYLFANHRPAGIEQLRKVIDAGETPYLEQARFYLAKGLLGSGDPAGARQQLNETIAMHGDLRQQAEALLARLK